MPRLRPDLVRRHAGYRGAGGQPGPQAVAREAGGVHSDGNDPLLDDDRNRLPR